MLRFALLLVAVAAAGGSNAVGADTASGDVLEAKTMKTLRRQTQITRQPCTCSGQSESCTCCGRVDQASLNFHQRGCASVRWGRRRSRTLRYDFALNNRTVGRTEATGTDPEPMCHPFLRFPYMDICARFHSTKLGEDGILEFCLTGEAKFVGYTFCEMRFDCVRYDTNNANATPTQFSSTK